MDNTLINYDMTFLYGARELGLVPPDWYGDKKQTRDYLRSQDGGESQWQNLQGQVYGQFITQAHLFDGAYRFLWRCHQRGFVVDLVSHKTEYGHNDINKVPLRQVALEFLASHGITPGEKNSLLREVFFENTREQKIQRIIENNYDWFIDDLTEVLADESLPNELGRILFDESTDGLKGGIENCRSWPEIEHRLLGAWTDPELLALAETLASATVTSVKKAALGGNSRLLEVETDNGKKYVLKLYPDHIGHDRLSSEYNSFKVIKAHNIEVVPSPLGCDIKLNAAMYEWIEGAAVNHPNNKHMHQALKFLEQLHGLRKLPAFENFQNASAAFLSGASFEEQLKNRFHALMLVAPESPELSDYLQSEVLPVLEEITSWTRSTWQIKPGYFEPLPRSQQTLSPSDFGFHNTVERENGKLIFVDFEYFGWDDPVKLIADFSFHPGMVLDPALKQRWIEGAVKIYGEEILERLRLAWPMIGLCWCLILLNEYRSDVWLRRCAANSEKSQHRKAILATQLRRSRDLLGMISERYKQPLFN